jgi:hypothetical protein
MVVADPAVVSPYVEQYQYQELMVVYQSLWLPVELLRFLLGVAFHNTYHHYHQQQPPPPLLP